MTLTPAFLHHVLRPGRYLGGELGLPPEAPGGSAAPVVWFYPGCYERAMTDPAYRRGFFQLRQETGAACVRGIEFAADVWPALEQYEIPPFALDGQCDLRQARTIVFWAPNVFAAAHIPSLLRRIGDPGPDTKVGVVVNGWSAPRFLHGNVDWIVPAPSGWLPRSLLDLTAGREPADGSASYLRDRDNWDQTFGGDIEPVPLLASDTDKTPQWIPRVDAGSGLIDLELLKVGSDGTLSWRSVAILVADAQSALTRTGMDGLRFCNSGFDCAELIAATLIELSRVHNMKRVQVDLPALAPEDYEKHWQSYKPHLIKPGLHLRMRPEHEPAKLIDLAKHALNIGWRQLTVAVAFDNYEQFLAVLPKAEEFAATWSSLTAGFDDKRLLRMKLAPAPIEGWDGPPSEPDETEFRRLAHHGRQFCENASCAFDNFHIEDVIARNWLASADADLWPRLAELELADSTDEREPSFNWLSWIRNRSGLTRPPEAPFSRRTGQPVAPKAADTERPKSTPYAAAASANAKNSHLYGRRRSRSAASRRLSAPNRTRLRVRWGKNADWRFYSHLDMVRTFERAIRMSGIPAAYSEGFHPRLKLSFGPPLAFGLTSRAEFLDVILERGVEPNDVDTLRRALPDGVFIEDGQAMPEQMPSLSESVNEAEYRAMIPMEPMAVQMAIQEVLSRPKIEWKRADRPDRKPVDPRNSLKTTSMEIVPDGVEWCLRVALGGTGTIRPTDWLAVLFNFKPDRIAEICMERTELSVRKGDTPRSPFDFP
jgi:radical SAM-linked protein